MNATDTETSTGETLDVDIPVEDVPPEPDKNLCHHSYLCSDTTVHENCKKLYGAGKCKCPDDMAPLEDFLMSTAAPLQEKILFDSPNRVTRLCDEFQDAIYSLHFDRHLTYNEKIECLTTAWQAVRSLMAACEARVRTTLLMWALRYTLDIIFMVEWSTLEQDVRDTIRSYIESTMPMLGDMPRIVHLCEYVLRQGDKPWSHPRLLKVMDGDLSVLKNVDLETIVEETAVMIALRLRRLCETKCDEMAFTLTSKALMVLRMVEPSHPFRKNATPNTVHFIFDMFLCYVHKFINVELFLQEVKKLDTTEAFRLIRRNANAESEYPRTLKFRTKVATLTANTFAASLMLEPITLENQAIYVGIMNEWLQLHRNVPVAKFRVIARKLLSTATSSRHLHVVCRLIMRMEIPSWNDLLLEFLVRVVTSELNELELQKSEKSSSAQVLIDHEKQLSVRYLELADLLKIYHPCLTNECILTAFSLNPTAENYKLVQSVALSQRRGIQAEDHQDESTPSQKTALVTHATLSPTSTGHVPGSSATSSSPSSTSAPNLILDLIESLNLPDHIRHDLSVLLISPRVKFLSWLQTWDKLQANCQKLLNPEAKLGIVQQGLAVANDHLQFLNLDYDLFRNLPESDVPGIEKGYEKFADSEDDDDESDDDDSDYGKHDGRSKRSAIGRPQKRGAKRNAKLSQVESSKTGVWLQSNSMKSVSDLHKIGTQMESRVRRMLEHQPNLISPFNRFMMQHIAQHSRMGNSTVSRVQLDEMYRQFYIQAIQAQLQMSQAYAVQLQRSVNQPERNSVAQSQRRSVAQPKRRTITQPQRHTVTQPQRHTVTQPQVHTESHPVGRPHSDNPAVSKIVRPPAAAPSIKETDRSQFREARAHPSPKLTQEQLVNLILEKTQKSENKCGEPRKQVAVEEQNTKPPENVTVAPTKGDQPFNDNVFREEGGQAQQSVMAPIQPRCETPIQSNLVLSATSNVRSGQQRVPAAALSNLKSTVPSLSRQTHLLAAMKRIGAIDPSKIIYVDSIVPASKRPLLADSAIEIREISDLTMRRTRTPTNTTENAPKLVEVDTSLSTVQNRPTAVTIIDQTRSLSITEPTSRPVMGYEQETMSPKLQAHCQEASQPANHSQLSNTLNSVSHSPKADTPPRPEVRIEELVGNDSPDEDDDDVVSVISARHLDDIDQMTDSETEIGDSACKV